MTKLRFAVLTLFVVLVTGFSAYNAADAVFQPVSVSLIASSKLYAEKKRQILCLADNIYYEAGNQVISGKMAVAFVTINRSQRPTEWPKDICDVVYQKHTRPSGGQTCQFSWVCENYKAKKINQEWWDQSYAVAKYVWDFYNEETDPTQGALFFHATYVAPKWKKEYARTVQIGDHIFYKFRDGSASWLKANDYKRIAGK